MLQRSSYREGAKDAKLLGYYLFRLGDLSIGRVQFATHRSAEWQGKYYKDLLRVLRAEFFGMLGRS